MFALKLIKNNPDNTVTTVGFVVRVEIDSPLYEIVDGIRVEYEDFGTDIDDDEIKGIQGVLATIAQNTAPQIVTESEFYNMGQIALLMSGQSFKKSGFYLIVAGDKTGFPLGQIFGIVDKLIETSNDSMWQRIEGDKDIAEECIDKFCDYEFMGVLDGDLDGYEDAPELPETDQIRFTKEEEQEILNDVRDLVTNAVQKKVDKIAGDKKANGLASDSPITYKLKNLSDVFNLPILRGCIVSDSYDRLYLTTPVILDDFLDRHNGPIVGERVVLTGHQVGKLRKAMNANTKTVSISNGCEVEEGAVLLAKKLCGQLASEEYELEER